MDARHFDRLTRALSKAGARRGLLGLLATLPVLGGLMALLDFDEVDAKGRRKRRKQRHKKRTGNRKKNRKGQRKGKKKPPACAPESVAQTCAGKCGSVPNNCRQTVDCGSCACEEGCPVCFTCQEGTHTPGACVPDPEQVGDACGEPSCVDGMGAAAPTCAASGACQPAPPVSCAPYTQCAGNACAAACATDADCGDGFFCDGANHCVADQNNGQPCVTASQCQSGFCVDGVCCDSACEGACVACDLGPNVGTCTAVGDRAVCGSGDICCGGTCVSGVCCADATCTAEEAPDCVDHDCVCAANSDTACADGEACCDDGCADLATDPDHCGSCGNDCNPAQSCAAGVCVCPPDTCPRNFVQQPDCTCACPAGFELVNGGCFRICNTTSCPGSACLCQGSMAGSGNFLCVDRLGMGPACPASDCPTGMSCNGGLFCWPPC